jgi:hypothetical protein
VSESTTRPDSLLQARHDALEMLSEFEEFDRINWQRDPGDRSVKVVSRRVVEPILRAFLEATEPQKPRHEWDDVRWQEDDSEYEASCWCGWTHTAWAYDAAEQALYAHLKENGITVG